MSPSPGEPASRVGALGRLRPAFRWKAGELGAAGPQARIGASTLALGGLLRHLTVVADYIFPPS